MREWKQQPRLETLKRLLRKLIILSILLSISIVGLIAVTYWTRTADYHFTVIGIDAYLLTPTFNGYRNHIEPHNLTNKQIGISVVDENFYNLTLRVTQTNNATGLLVNATGRYYQVWYKGDGYNTHETVEPLGDSFDIPLNGSVYLITESEKWQIMYNDIFPPPSQGSSSEKGYMMIITFNVNTEYVFTGDYLMTCTFELGVP